MSTELAERPDAAPATLFGTNDPRQVVAQAKAIAAELGTVLKDLHLTARISGREHVLVEGWTLLGSMTGVFAEVEWSRPIYREGRGGVVIHDGWEARAIARTMSGKVVGSAEAQCSRAETTWEARDDYALRSMAQTRAVSKALRLPLGFIVELAGYAATPAEELGPPERRARPDPIARGPRTGQAAIREELDAAAQVRGLERTQVLGIAQEVVKGERATMSELREMLRRVEEYPIKEEEVSDGDYT